MYLITWITTHLPTPEEWMAELAKAHGNAVLYMLYMQLWSKDTHHTFHSPVT